MNKRIAYQWQTPAFIIVLAGVTSTGEKTPLIFIKERVKKQQHVYLILLKDQLILWINRTFSETGITIQQDRATFHTANVV